MDRKKLLKRILGQPAAGRLTLKGTVSIFVYHDVSDSPSRFCEEFGLNVAPKLFVEHIRWISDNFNVINPDQLLEGRYKTPAAMITFDDGMPGYFREAVPMMIKKNIASTVFLNMAPIEGELFWSGLVTYLSLYDKKFQEFLRRFILGDRNIPDYLLCDTKMVNDYLATIDLSPLKNKVRLFYGDFATAKDLDSFNGHPLVFYGNHLYNHYNVLRLKDEDLRAQYFLNEEKILKYHNGRTLFAYPFGQPGICFLPSQTTLIRSFEPKAIFSSGGHVNRIDGRSDAGRLYDRIGIDASIETVEDLFGRIQGKRLKKWLSRR